MLKQRKEMLKKQGKKGFTLVELIVVIVILGILVAIAVPALIGYIDRAQNQSAIVEAGTARVAMQTIISEAYAHNGEYIMNNGDPVTVPLGTGTSDVTDVLDAAIDELTGTTGNLVYELTLDGNLVTGFVMSTPVQGGSGTVEFTGNNFVVTP